MLFCRGQQVCRRSTGTIYTVMEHQNRARPFGSKKLDVSYKIERHDETGRRFVAHVFHDELELVEPNQEDQDGSAMWRTTPIPATA